VEYPVPNSLAARRWAGRDQLIAGGFEVAEECLIFHMKRVVIYLSQPQFAIDSARMQALSIRQRGRGQQSIVLNKEIGRRSNGISLVCLWWTGRKFP